MDYRKFILPALVLSTVLGGVGAATLPATPAQAQATTNAPPAANPARPPRPPRASHIDGRIAFLKAELKITPAQEAPFDRLAQVLRQNATERRQSFEQARPDRDQPRNAVQRLEVRARMSAMQAQQSDRYLAAFRPLYESLSAEQRKAADDLMAPRGHFRRGRI